MANKPKEIKWNPPNYTEYKKRAIKGEKGEQRADTTNQMTKRFKSNINHIKCKCYKPRFLNLSIIDILYWMIYLLWGWPYVCRMFNSIPGLYPLGASSILSSPVVTTKNTTRHSQMPQGGKIFPSPH